MQQQEKTGFVESSQVCTDLSLSSPSLQSKSNEKKRGKKRKMKMENEWKCSTSLELYENPWKIRKVLTKSDTGRLSRLLLGADVGENFMLPVLDSHAQTEVINGTGSTVSVWDVDTMSMHNLILKRWPSFNNFVLMGRWSSDFVQRRQLIKGDEIGLLWDSFKHCFHFSVLKRNH
ncbi:B3 domain-containing protein At2g33720-like [Vigna unguiculata]|uniref:TF-B3 domain-containing protein n=1 Tax=Vigna unguiculata TaxID=3917 RepID=A0A4D6NHH3_VIGUN|nr:B3 domain-containing protein At2g33720-like [Vigna unguiculata]QCE13190.1 hypothetical protein DEO72_LG11g183 [Vigna unguiculata]